MINDLINAHVHSIILFEYCRAGTWPNGPTQQQNLTMSSALFDCVVIGGGPAGLLAAVYLARFRRSTLLVHSGKSRARWIPKTRNVPGYPRGIAGPNLLARLGEQLACYNVARESGSVGALTGTCGDFTLHGDTGSWPARRVILATGVKDNVPHDLEMLWALVPQGRVRLCPVCDAYELCGKRIGVLSRGHHAVQEAKFLAGYSKSVALLTHGTPDLDDSLRAALQAADISLHESPVIQALDGSMLTVTLNDDSVLEFDALYVGFGVQAHSQLAVEAGAQCDAAGYVCVNQTQQTTVPGLYAAGDVVQSLSQISVAFGQAAIAASAVNIALNDEGIRATPA